MKSRLRIAVLVAILSACMGVARAEDLVWAIGRVTAADGRTPLVGAVVAVYDDKNRVIDYAKTDAKGEYALAMPRSALHLGSKGGGFFHQVTNLVGGATRLAAWPLRAGIRVAADAANATDPLTKVGVGAASGLAGSIIDTIAPDDNKKKKAPPSRTAPGAFVMKVSAPGHNDAISIAHVYWMQEEIYKAGGKEQRAISAWVDPAKMTVAGDAKPSSIESEYLLFTAARVEPSIAEPGQTVTVTVTMPTPSDPKAPVVVVARDSRNGRTFELSPIGGNQYRGEITVDKSFPRDDQTICVLAYAEQDDRPGRSKKVEDAINGAGLWNPGKPFVYNPLLVASRNRAEVVLTVVEPPKRR